MSDASGSQSPSDRNLSLEHCVSKIAEIIAQNGSDRRSVFQLGYNLGRLSELTGLGRKPFWDRWKDAVTEWNRTELEKMAQELRNNLSAKPPEPNPS